MDQQKMSLMYILILIAKRRTFILRFTLATAICAVIYSLITPQIWESRATFYAVENQSSQLPINVMGLGKLTSSFLNNDSSTMALNFATILNSRTFSEGAIRKFNLESYYKIKEVDSLRAMDIALKRLQTKTIGISVEPQSGLITVSAQTRNKELSKNIAQYYVQNLEKYNQEYKMTTGKMNRVFLEKRVAEVKTTIDTLSNQMRNFQKQYKAIDLETQLTSAVQLYSDVIAQKMKTDIDLELAKQNYSSTAPSVKSLEAQQRILQNKIYELESSAKGLKPQYMLSIDQIPDLSVRYAQLKLNLDIQLKVFEYIYPLYEQARLEELKDMPTLEMVDYPREAGLRVKPQRAILCIIATISGFIISLLITLLMSLAFHYSDKLKILRKVLLNPKQYDA
jgi:tyrosine-protein kinase Etk/Wzc